MINILLIGAFAYLIFSGKKDIAIKIVQSYLRTLFTQFIDFRTRTTNAWLYIFTVINLFIISKVFEGVLEFVLDSDTSSGTIAKLVIFCLCIVSSFSILVRRLHDIDKPGWLIVVGMVFPPFLIVLMLMIILPGTEGTNKYGRDPKSLPYWYLR